MKGLLMQDLMSNRRTLMIYAVLWIIMTALQGASGALFALVFTMMLPVNALSMDESAHFDRLELMLPVRPWQSVLSKYMLSDLAIALCMLSAIAVESIQRGQLTIPALVIVAASSALLIHAGMLVMVFHLGVMRGRMVYVLCIFLICAMTGFLGAMAEQPPAWLTGLGWHALLLPLCIALHVASIPLSVRGYARRMTA